jgi:hypothetical protein
MLLSPSAGRGLLSARLRRPMRVGRTAGATGRAAGACAPGLPRFHRQRPVPPWEDAAWSAAGSARHKTPPAGTAPGGTAAPSAGGGLPEGPWATERCELTHAAAARVTLTRLAAARVTLTRLAAAGRCAWCRALQNVGQGARSLGQGARSGAPAFHSGELGGREDDAPPWEAALAGRRST